jgi:hypothetical protein
MERLREEAVWFPAGRQAKLQNAGFLGMGTIVGSKSNVFIWLGALY